ncbi:hypothetical protein COCNU_03G003640 [Cocos nucifera]|uniref:Uncharacterized protein n=1 Tax=Cocos nucifera TaxID=13894 RepID=A0A8K0I1R4_COCNU|nr:hypothetical protein COCNU_03G003640 [Cocos nucifera]
MPKVIEANAKVAKAEQKAEAYVRKAKEQVAKVEHRTKEWLAEAHRLAVEAFRASKDFMQVQVSTVEKYKASKEWHKEKMVFSQDAYKIGYGVSFNDRWCRVAAQFPEADLSFLDEDNEEGDVEGEAFSQKFADME